MSTSLGDKLKVFDDELRAALAKARTADHAGTQGTAAENAWLLFLTQRLPARYGVTSGQTFDSAGATSQQQDLVIHDPQYSALMFGDDHPLVPVEAVYAVVEGKPSLDLQNLSYASQKASSVRGQHRTSVPIPHAGGVYPEKPLTRQLAGLFADTTAWIGTTTSKHVTRYLDDSNDGDGALDLVFADGFAFSNLVDPERGERILRQHQGPGALAWLLLELLRGLSMLGTVAAIDYAAYRNALDRPKP